MSIRDSLQWAVPNNGPQEGRTMQGDPEGRHSFDPDYSGSVTVNVTGPRMYVDQLLDRFDLDALEFVNDDVVTVTVDVKYP